MNLVVATIPEDPAELAGWLERRLVGLELDGLVAELAAIHEAATASRPSLAQLLGGKLDQVRTAGLSCLSGDQVRLLLTRPMLLLDLQEEVLTTGGAYWDQVSRTMPMMHLKVEEGRKHLPREAGSGVKPRSVNLRPAAAVTPSTTTTTKPTAWYTSAFVASLATAAALLLAFGVWQWSQPVVTRGDVAWGWQNPDAVNEDARASDYLNGLADAAHEWFAKKPDDAPALARRIGEMRQGCSRLILAAHKPLEKKDREWLIDRCQAWAVEFDKALTALEKDRDVAKVQQQMDATVEKMTKALRDRARQVA